MRRVLIVAYYFPPIAGIGSIRLAGLARHLPEFGWEPMVLAPERTPHPEDPSIPFSPQQVVRSGSIELSRLGRRVPGRRMEGAGGRFAAGGRGVRAAGLRWLYPDAQIGWYPPAVTVGRRLVRDQSFDAVYSSSVPITAHLVARRLSRRGQLPWIAEYRDPWSDRLGRDHPHQARATRLEAEIAASASRLIMPSATWAEHFGKRWAIRIEVIRNGFDLRPQPPAMPPDEPILAHLGSFWPGRQSLAPIWAGLRRLSEARGAPMPKVVFIGELDPAVAAEARDAGIPVEATGLVSHAEALEILGGATVLFASGELGDDPIARGTIPAKLFEYLASGLPVVYVGDPAGEAAALLSDQAGCFVVESSDVEGVVDALGEGFRGERHDRDIDHLGRRAGARRLAETLDSVVGGG